MRNIRKLKPIMPPCCHNHALPRCTLLADGATAVFPFYFTNRTFTFNDVAQLTYLFNYGNSSIDYYELYDSATGQIDPGSEEAGYSFVRDEIANSVSLIFSPNHVSTIPTETVIEFEIVIKLKDGTTLVDRQMPIMIKPSIYGDLIDSTKKINIDKPVVSQSITCSTRISCNE